MKAAVCRARRCVNCNSVQLLGPDISLSEPRGCPGCGDENPYWDDYGRVALIEAPVGGGPLKVEVPAPSEREGGEDYLSDRAVLAEREMAMEVDQA